MAANGKVIGTVTAVVGEAKATAADGTVRILQVGDQVHSDEVISTSAAGSINVALANGKTLDCGADADLALHQGLLDVAVTAAPSGNASDVDSIQRAIAAGQDPSQVAAATAAGGAPAAGGDVDGGAHSAVILEQSNSASVVSSGFSTEGDTLAFETPVTQIVAGVVPASNQAPVIVSVDQETVPLPLAFDNSAPASIPVFVEAPQADAPAAPAAPVIVVADTSAPEETGNTQAPVVVAQPNEPAIEQPSAEAPIIVAQPNEPADEQPQSDAPIVVVQPNEPTGEQPTSDEPIIVAQPNEPTDEQPTSDEPVVIVQPNEPTDESTGDVPPVVVVTDEPTGDVPPVVVVTDEGDSTPPVIPNDGPTDELPGSVSLTYSISANTNQDEQIGRLIFENGENKYETLVFFGQEGQQKPTAVALQFDLTEGTSTVKLQYVDAFAGNSDAGTGHTAQKIAIKDFGLGIDGEPVVLAQQSDGVNIGTGSKNIHAEGVVNVDMSTGEAGEWTFGDQSEGGAVDILDLTGATLIGTDIAAGTEVVNLMGSAAQELTLNATDVLNISESGVLHIVGGKEDSLKLDTSWTIQDGDSSAAGAQPTYFGWVQVTHNDATLLVDPDVSIKGASMG